jgi:hypothetical protein
MHPSASTGQLEKCHTELCSKSTSGKKRWKVKKRKKEAADLHFSGAVHSNLLVKPAG